ncbi:uncharacterized protein AB9X84_024430 isoform 1-T1 [Acanthopagrus schlegelii]
MFGRILLLICVAVFFHTDAEDPSRHNRRSQEHEGDTRRPAVTGGELDQAVEGNQPTSRDWYLLLLCGGDGNTYSNECALCVHRLDTNADILIVKDEAC